MTSYDDCKVVHEVIQHREFPCDYSSDDYDTCLSSDGCIEKIKDGLLVNSHKFRRHDFPTKAHFQYELRDKCIYEVRDGYTTCFGAKLSAKTYSGCPPDCYLDRIRNLGFEYRISNGNFFVLDPEHKFVFGFLLTNGGLFAWYGRYPWCWKRFDKCAYADDSYYSEDECELKCGGGKGPDCCREEASDFCERKNKLGCEDYESYDDDCCHKKKKKHHGGYGGHKKCDSYDSCGDDSYDYYHSYDYGKKKHGGYDGKKKHCKDSYDSCGYGKGKPYGSKKDCYDSCGPCGGDYDSCTYDSCSGYDSCKCDHKKYKPDYWYNKSYAAFHYTKLCVRREDCNPLCAFKDVRICFVKKGKKQCVQYWVDECLCWEVACTGHRQPEQYSAIEYGGWPDIRNYHSFPSKVQVVFGTGKMLDAVLPDNYNRSEAGAITQENRNNTALLAHYPLDWYKNTYPDRCGTLAPADCDTFCDTQTDCHENWDAALFGQGAKLLIRSYKVYRVRCPEVCEEIVHDGKYCPEKCKDPCDPCKPKGHTGYGHH